MTTGERIRTRRAELGLSLNKLAKKADISPAYLSGIENDKQSDPSLSKARQLATALETTIGHLFSGHLFSGHLFSGPEIWEACQHCRYFEPTDSSTLNGICRRYPPVVCLDSSDEVQSMCPDVMKSDWCGEFKPKEDLC